MKKDCSKDFTTNLRDIIQTNSITNSLSFFLLFRRNQKTKITFLGLSVKVGMRNRERNEGNDGNAWSQGGNAGNQGDSLLECSCLLLRLKSQSARRAFQHSAFMGSCSTIIQTYLVLSTKVDEFYFK